MPVEPLSGRLTGAARNVYKQEGAEIRTALGQADSWLATDVGGLCIQASVQIDASDVHTELETPVQERILNLAGDKQHGKD